MNSSYKHLSVPRLTESEHVTDVKAHHYHLASYLLQDCIGYMLHM